jgi:predicted transcriptional regulator
MEFNEWAKLQESLLKAQLRIIRQFLKDGEQPKFKPRGKGRSQMSVIYDLLLAAPKPLHVTEIIERAKIDFNVQLDRDSIVSALSKKVKSGRMFKRVKANTFTIADHEKEHSP